MIRSFRSKEMEQIFSRFALWKLPADIQRVALRKHRMLHRSRTLADLRVTSANRLEALQGERKGQYSIRINDQWRICFRWEAGNAYDVEILDYR